MENQEKLIKRLKQALYEEHLSLRKLSDKIKIDVATLSRIFNKKQRPHIDHLEKLAIGLNLPLEALLADMGYIQEKEQHIKGGALGKLIHENEMNNKAIFEACTSLEDEKIIKDIEKQLAKYEQYMNIAEGEKMIKEQFKTKVEAVGQIGPIIDLLREFYEQLCKKDISTAMFVLIGSGLLYFIISPDVIPDFLFPLGFVDDVIALKIIKWKLEHL